MDSRSKKIKKINYLEADGDQIIKMANGTKYQENYARKCGELNTDK